MISKHRLQPRISGIIRYTEKGYNTSKTIIGIGPEKLPPSVHEPWGRGNRSASPPPPGFPDLGFRANFPTWKLEIPTCIYRAPQNMFPQAQAIIQVLYRHLYRHSTNRARMVLWLVMAPVVVVVFAVHCGACVVRNQENESGWQQLRPKIAFRAVP